MHTKPIKKYSFLIQLFSMILGTILLSTLISLFLSGFNWFTSFENYFHRTLYGSVVGIALGAGNWLIGVYTSIKLNWRKNLTRATLTSLLMFVFYGITISIAIPYVFSKYFWHNTGNDHRSAVMVSAFITMAIDMIIISFYYSLYLVYYWKKSIQGYEELKRESITAQYNALKNQVNPHFLFNSLNTLSGIVEKDPNKAVLFIKKLSDIYRYVLEQQAKELVKIEEELQFIDDFIFLLKIRHGQGLRLTNQLKSVDSYIVPLGLQLPIENCIKHNVVSDDLPLDILLYEEENYLVICNNLQRKSSVPGKDSQGLDNLKSRYSYLTDLPVLIQESETEFLVKIPLIKNSTE